MVLRISDSFEASLGCLLTVTKTNRMEDCHQMILQPLSIIENIVCLLIGKSVGSFADVKFTTDGFLSCLCSLIDLQ